MPKRAKLSPKEKERIVKLYLSGAISQSEAARNAGVDRHTFMEWVSLYESEGVHGFQYSKNKSYSAELKLQVVREYLNSNTSQDKICRKYGIRCRTQLRNWIKVYNAYGDFNTIKHSGGGSYMKRRKDTTQEERIAITKDCIENGKNYGATAIKYKVSYQQARDWTRRFEELGEAGLEDRRGKRKKDQLPRTELEKLKIENEQLKHQLYLAEVERDLLKKLDEIERRDASRK